MAAKVGEKKMLNEALDLLYGICRKVALNADTHDNVTMAANLLRAEVNKKEEEKKKGEKDGNEE